LLAFKGFLWYNIIVEKTKGRRSKMYENLTRYELECCLNFFENHNKYIASELAKANEKSFRA